MGTRRRYFRFTPDQLRRSLADPDFALAMLEVLREAHGRHPDLPPEDARVLNVDKAWAFIDVTLDTAGLPLEAHNGVRLLYPDEHPPPPEMLEWMDDAERRFHGPPTYLTAEEVRTAAAQMARAPFADLVDDVDPATVPALTGFAAADWAAGASQTTHHGGRLQRFFAAAARAGDAIASDLS